MWSGEKANKIEVEVNQSVVTMRCAGVMLTEAGPGRRWKFALKGD